MAVIGDVKEHRADPLFEDDSGLRGGRNFTIIARSELDARNFLRSKAGVFHRGPVATILGEQPDTRARYTDLSFTPSPDAVLGGVGMYKCNAKFGIPDFETPLPGGKSVWRWSGALQSGPVDTDRDGKPIENTVGEPFDPPTSAPLPVFKLSISWYTDSFPVTKLTRFTGATNSDTFTAGDGSGSLTRGQILCLSLAPVPADDGLVLVTGQFAVRADTWTTKVINRGRRKKVGINGDGTCKWQVLTDAMGQPLSEPANLTADGKVLACGADPVILEFDVPHEEAYAELGAA